MAGPIPRACGSAGVLVSFFVAVTKYLRKQKREEGYILAHGLKGFIPWSFGTIVSGPAVRQNIMVEGYDVCRAAYPRAARRQSERDRKTLQIHTHSNLLPPGGPPS
jgi:hypothetical protein